MTTSKALIIETIQTATAKVFSTMIDKQLKLEEVHEEGLKTSGLREVVARISLSGDCTLTSQVKCSEEVACRIASAMLMEDRPTVDADVLDALAEVANMIMGSVKTDLDQQLGVTNLGLPTAVQEGVGGASNSLGWVVIPFVVENEQFSLRVCFEPQPKLLHSAGSMVE